MGDDMTDKIVVIGSLAVLAHLVHPAPASPSQTNAAPITFWDDRLSGQSEANFNTAKEKPT